MAINYHPLVMQHPRPSDKEEMDRVGNIAQAFRQELERVSAQIDEAHAKPRTSSVVIQNIFLGWLEDNYDARIEVTEGFKDTATPRVRPDAQIPLNASATRRILVEVERGGTVTNGHDLKDMWKAHLSPVVQHLFLVVPNSITDQEGESRSDQAFVRCKARLGNFFVDARTEVDVLSVHLFGYGPPWMSKSDRAASKGATALAVPRVG